MITSKTMTNLQIAGLLRAVAAALELEPGDNRFRIIAYNRAADAVEHATSEAKDLWDDGELKNLPGIGANLFAHLDELFNTGKVGHFEEILNHYPPALFELLEIPGIGPKSAFRLCKALGLNKAHTAVSQLEKAAKHGHIAKIEGFGADSQAQILKSIKEYRGRSVRMLLPRALKITSELTDWLKKDPHVLRADPLGSLRRHCATVGDIDIAVATNHPKGVIAHFSAYPKKIRVLEAGEHTASLVLPGDCQIDLMVQPSASYGSLLQHFTGSKHHNIALREYAMKKGLSLSEYGIKTKTGMKEFSTEESFYNYLGLEYIPPELREDTGEIKVALDHHLPRLVELSDIRGDLQLHSNINVEPGHDLGTGTPDQMAQKARELGYEYLGLTEHNPSVSGHTAGQMLEIIKIKTHQISEANHIHEKDHEKGFPYIFNGLEIDIGPDGRRSVPDSCLDLLDYACVSVHSSFQGTKKLMTDRVLSALDHPKVRFFAHPTTRLLQEREGIDLDWDRLFDFCKTHSKWLEIDAWPNRLDLPDVLVKEAVNNGIGLVIDTDSHSVAEMDYLEFGIWVARRGWAAKNDIVNTLPLTQMRKLLNKGGE